MKHIHLEIKNDIALLCFDREGAAVNIFDHHVLSELDEALTLIEHNTSLTGLIIHSAKPHIFIAGADIKTLSSAPLPEIKELIHFGQNVFDRLATLKIPIVAAIHGACVGGGYELALACDWRVASDASCTQVGLPEVLLGLLPAWGGCTRLPTLIGLPKALSAILSGKLHKPKLARHKGLVDAIVAQENLVKFSMKILRRGKRHHSLHIKFHNPISVAIIKSKAREDLYKKSRGLYPAPIEALEVMCKGVLATHQGSLHYESEAFVRLVQKKETKELIRLFFLTERQKKLPIAKQATKQLEHTSVIGAGVMGAGIAYWLATRKKEVTLKDINADAVAKGMGSIEKMVNTSVKRRILEKHEAAHIMDRIYPSSDKINLYHTDLVIEAAVEQLDIKKKIFSELSTLTEADCILATNTSALPITELAEFNANPERVIGLHFFNPVPRMKLVEVVKTKYTSDEVLANAVKFVTSIGKLPVVVNDSPGFLVNRILLPYLVAAGEMFTDGHEPQELDEQMLDFGMPMGPIRLLDEVGLDVAHHVATTLCEAFPDRMRIPRILQQLVDQGCYGRKSGKGFYVYNKKSKDLQVNPIARSLQDSYIPSVQKPADKLVHLMSDEAQRCLDEGIAETADEIDFAMIMGTGYAPFRGGPLRHASSCRMQQLQ